MGVLRFNHLAASRRGLEIDFPGDREADGDVGERWRAGS
jgi:hypothetical protein